MNAKVYKIPKAKLHILFRDKLMRQGRADDLAPFTFEDQEEAEKFILNHRQDGMCHGDVRMGTEYLIFTTATDLGTAQWH